VKYYWEIITHRLGKTGFTWGCVSTVNANGQTIFAADAHRDDELEDDKRHRSDYLERFFAAQILGHTEIYDCYN
jgi:hypothetical protein